jgi:hypothetical protein
MVDGQTIFLGNELFRKAKREKGTKRLDKEARSRQDVTHTGNREH